MFAAPSHIEPRAHLFTHHAPLVDCLSQSSAQSIEAVMHAPPPPLEERGPANEAALLESQQLIQHLLLAERDTRSIAYEAVSLALSVALGVLLCSAVPSFEMIYFSWYCCTLGIQGLTGSNVPQKLTWPNFAFHRTLCFAACTLCYCEPILKPCNLTCAAHMSAQVIKSLQDELVQTHQTQQSLRQELTQRDSQILARDAYSVHASSACQQGCFLTHRLGDQI
eukprot:606478-Pelagomonas_calceolata.AAC.1